MPGSSTESPARVASWSSYVALRHLVRAEPLTVGPATSVRETLLLLDRTRADAVVVVDAASRAPLGIVTLPDVVRRIGIEACDLQAPIATVMTSGLITVPADGTVHQASVVMVRRGVRHLVLTEADGSYFNLVSRTDLYTLPGAQNTDLVQAILGARSVATVVTLAMASLRGVVWSDDGDGHRANGEPAIPAVAVTLYYTDANDQVQSAGANTDAAGAYTFTLLAAGEYQLGFMLGEGFAYGPLWGPGFDNRVEEAAADLGANEWTTFWRVTVPLIAPGILSGAMLAFTLSLDDFVITFFTSGPGSTTLPIYVYGLLRRVVTPEVNALSTLWILAVLVAVSISQWFQNRE